MSWTTYRVEKLKLLRGEFFVYTQYELPVPWELVFTEILCNVLLYLQHLQGT
jgi:hypothetical protein